MVKRTNRELMSVMVDCKCGSTVRHFSMVAHLASKKHSRFINNDTKYKTSYELLDVYDECGVCGISVKHYGMKTHIKSKKHMAKAKQA